MRKHLIACVFTAMALRLSAQTPECETFVAEYETWSSETAASLEKTKGKNLSSKEIEELKMDYEQWAVNIEAFKKNGCPTDIYRERIVKANLKAKKALGIKDEK